MGVAPFKGQAELGICLTGRAEHRIDRFETARSRSGPDQDRLPGSHGSRLLTAEGDQSVSVHALRWGSYALLQVLEGVALLAMAHHLTIRHLRSEGTPLPSVRDEGTVRYGIIIGFGLSIPVFFLTSYGWVLWIAGPLLTRRVYLPLLGRQRQALSDR
jgi:hypothetical protein